VELVARMRPANVEISISGAKCLVIITSLYTGAKEICFQHLFIRCDKDNYLPSLNNTLHATERFVNSINQGKISLFA